MVREKVSRWLGRTVYGDVREQLVSMALDGVQVQTIVTSPPYWGLRSYTEDPRMLGLEPSIELWVSNLQHVFDLCWNILAPNGTLWLNLGDAHVSTGGSGFQGQNGYRATRRHTQKALLGDTSKRARLPAKNLMGQPWRAAFALQDAGWILRSEIIWEKPNAMPESAKDRPTSCHEKIFLFSKTRHYKYRGDAIAEPSSPNTHMRMAQNLDLQGGSTRANGGTEPDRPFKAGGRKATKKVAGWADGKGSHSTKEHARAAEGHRTGAKFGRGPNWRQQEAQGIKANESFAASTGHVLETRNARNVWRFPTEPFPGAHFATFPRELPRRCILASTDPGDIVFDPFMGSGTVAQVAESLGRQWIGAELDERCEVLFKQYRQTTKGLPL